MPGEVVRVLRRERLGWLAPVLLRSLAVTARHLVRNLRRGVRSAEPLKRGWERRPGTFRGMPVLVADDDGRPRCVACERCAVACPTHCIVVEAGESERDPGAPELARFELDLARCMYCGLCEEACPEEAIVMSPLVELAGADRAALRRGIEELLVPAEFVEKRLAILRAARTGDDR